MASSDLQEIMMAYDASSLEHGFSMTAARMALYQVEGFKERQERFAVASERRVTESEEAMTKIEAQIAADEARAADGEAK